MKYPFKINELLSSKIKTNDLTDKHLKAALNFSKLHKIEQFFISHSKMFNDKREWAREWAQLSFNKALTTDLQQRSEAKYLENILSRQKINFIFLKGIALKKTVYKKIPHMRECRDIDILIEPGKISEAVSALINQGYRFLVLKNQRSVNINYMKGHQAPVMVSPRGNYVELHYRITTNHMECKLGQEILHNSNNNLAVHELNYLNICVHAYKNYFNIGLNCIIDIEILNSHVNQGVLEEYALSAGLINEYKYMISLFRLNYGMNPCDQIDAKNLEIANRLLYAGEKIIPFNFSFKNPIKSLQSFRGKYSAKDLSFFEKLNSITSIAKYLVIKLFLHLRSKILYRSIWLDRKNIKPHLD